jgi:DNA-binding LytR/AlgR family response regulator
VRDVINDLHNQNESLLIEKKLMQKEVEKYEDDLLNMSIEFPSENNSENLKLSLSDIVFIKSADNYVEIAYKEGDDFKKKLLRNTLKNIELQLKPYSCFVRCHRISIVNIHHVEKLNRSDNNNYLIIKGYDEQIPVSRQYLVKLKESL